LKLSREDSAGLLHILENSDHATRESEGRVADCGAQSSLASR
jgi:hypothetical protein